ncbi:MAG: TrkH family potassium uptake protein [Prevotellaceae bacterium]|jgi:trk system potassium uptake protein TrkH|nr:TrkH family potassium uptake protein [Prevotellaceae bacterium]
MRPGLIVRYISFVLLINAAFMLLSALVSVFDGIGSDFFPLLLSSFITFTVGCFPFIFVPKNPHLNNKEINVFVVLAWFMSCVFGTLPYVLWGGEFNVANAWFESVSGFTTTGATILTDIESLPHGLLFWRSSTHYIGGIGIVLFAVLVLQSQYTTQVRLTNAEVSLLAKDNFHFKAQQLLRVIVSVYIGITIILTLLLMLFGMSLFDAINHALSTVATGGFSTKNGSISSFNSVPVGIIIMIFMIISGMHFGIIYSTITGRTKAMFHSPIIRFYLASMGICTIIVTTNLLLNGNYSDFFDAFYNSAFQVVAITSTTGFATADTTIWHPVAMCVLIYLSAQCACAGSTSGGIKVDRIYILWRSIVAQLKIRQHPNAIVSVRLANNVIDSGRVSSAMTYISLYLFIVFVATFILSMFNIDLLSGFTTSLAFMGNVGPGIGEYGSFGNYAALPDIIKFTYPIFMLLGRLEIYALFLLFLHDKHR